MTLFDVEALIKQQKAEKAQKGMSHRVRALLRLMVEMDLDKEVTAGLLSLADADTNHICYIAGPAIVHRCAWMDVVPSWVFKAIALDRLDQVFAEIETGVVGDLATPSEVVAYMMPATLEAPIGSRWTNVYLWAASESLVKHKRLRDGGNPWDFIGGQPVAYSAIKYDYERMARDIRSDVIAAAKTRGWGSVRGEMKKALTPLEVESPEDELIEQPDLFSAAVEESGEAPISSGPPVKQTNLFDLLGD